MEGRRGAVGRLPGQTPFLIYPPASGGPTHGPQTLGCPEVAEGGAVLYGVVRAQAHPPIVKGAADPAPERGTRGCWPRQAPPQLARGAPRPLRLPPARAWGRSGAHRGLLVPGPVPGGRRERVTGWIYRDGGAAPRGGGPPFPTYVDIYIYVCVHGRLYACVPTYSRGPCREAAPQRLAHAPGSPRRALPRLPPPLPPGDHANWRGRPPARSHQLVASGLASPPWARRPRAAPPTGQRGSSPAPRGRRAPMSAPRQLAGRPRRRGRGRGARPSWDPPPSARRCRARWWEVSHTNLAKVGLTLSDS